MLSPEAERLLALQERVRWGIVGLFWVALGLPSIWVMRVEFGRLLDYFTWAGLRYSFLSQSTAGFCLLLAIAVTVSTLLWQSHLELFGLSSRAHRQLEQEVRQIQMQGKEHPLWKVINPGKEISS